MRAMLIEFPDDPACDTLDRQCMLGESRLVAPVFTEDGTIDYYLPPARWTHLLTGQLLEGPGWQREKHGFLSLPLIVRPGSVLPLGATDDRPDYDYRINVTFRIYELASGQGSVCALSVPQRTDAVELRVQREGERILANISGEISVPWQVQIAGAKKVTIRKAARTVPDPLGITIHPTAGSDHVEFHL